MNDDRLISVLCAQQWEKCKGELNALISLQGSRLTKYQGNQVLKNREWEILQKIFNTVISEVEDNELHV